MYSKNVGTKQFQCEGQCTFGKQFTQQEQILGELYWYIHQNPLPPDASSVSEALKYLEACSQLFEKRFLSHSKITSTNSKV